MSAAYSEVAHLRSILVFADGLAVANTGFALADLYAEDCEWAQVALREAGCHPRGSIAKARAAAAEPETPQ